MPVSEYQGLRERLKQTPRRWLVTGAAGFIGSHLVEALLGLGQEVVGLDNYSTGHQDNLEDLRDPVGETAWKHFQFIRGDISDLATCRKACRGIHVVLHQAALGSVPRSLESPLDTHRSNVDGFLNMLVAARDSGCGRFVYASSSSVYGDSAELPKKEDRLGAPLSPYAASKLMNEIHAGVFHRCYGLPVVGLRYFNVFGPRQDPAGPYAAVIPCWIQAILRGERPRIHGDGETTRDFCPVENVVQANLLAAHAGEKAWGKAFNVALGGRVTLLELFRDIHSGLEELGVSCGGIRPRHGPFREGDVRHSQADIQLARQLLGYRPGTSFAQGMKQTLSWFKGREA